MKLEDMKTAKDWHMLIRPERKNLYARNHVAWGMDILAWIFGLIGGAAAIFLMIVWVVS